MDAVAQVQRVGRALRLHGGVGGFPMQTRIGEEGNGIGDGSAPALIPKPDAEDILGSLLQECGQAEVPVPAAVIVVGNLHHIHAVHPVKLHVGVAFGVTCNGVIDIVCRHAQTAIPAVLTLGKRIAVRCCVAFRAAGSAGAVKIRQSVPEGCLRRAEAVICVGNAALVAEQLPPRPW